MAKKPDYTLEQIQPLIITAEADGNKMFCEFSLPGSDEIIESTVPIKRLKTAKSAVSRSLKRVGASQLRRGASRAVRMAFGSGIVGRVMSQTTQAATRATMSGGASGGSKEEEEAAIIQAFIKVQDHFFYNEDKGEWEKPPLPPPPPTLSPFEQQMKENPIANKYDQQILARIMAELAYADGSVSGEEKEFFDSMIPEEVGSIEKLVQGDPVSKIEAQEVTEEAKSSIFMFAWVISLIDYDVDPVEEELLMEYGEIFGFSEDQIDDLTLKAKCYVLESTIDADISRQELFDLADKINMDHGDAERCKIQMIKRM